MKEGTSNKDMSGTGGTDQSTKKRRVFSLELSDGLTPKEKEDTRLKSHTQNNKPKQEKVIDPVKLESDARTKTGII